MLEGYPKERGFCDLTEEEKDYLLSLPHYGTGKWAISILKAANKDKDLEEKYGKEYIAMLTEEEKVRLRGAPLNIGIENKKREDFAKHQKEMTKHRVWHDREEPAKQTEKLVFLDEGAISFFTPAKGTWNDVMRKFDFEKWAYLSDIISDDLYIYDEEYRELDKKAMDEYWPDQHISYPQDGRY